MLVRSKTSSHAIAIPNIFTCQHFQYWLGKHACAGPACQLLPCMLLQHHSLPDSHMGRLWVQFECHDLTHTVIISIIIIIIFEPDRLGVLCLAFPNSLQLRLHKAAKTQRL